MTGIEALIAIKQGHKVTCKKWCFGYIYMEMIGPAEGEIDLDFNFASIFLDNPYNLKLLDTYGMFTALISQLINEEWEIVE